MAEKGYEVIVKFDTAIGPRTQGMALMRMEKFLREQTNLDIRVVKDLQGDDSKLRVLMTPEMRAKL